MDKYEYNLKLEEIDKLVDQADYEEAAKLADTIDWRRVRNVRTLCLISEIYEASGRLEDSKTILLRAYRRAPVGRTVLYRLVEVTTSLKQFDEAIEYYSEYVQAAPHDNNRYILKYQIYKGRGSSKEELISILEEYLGQEYTERWAYELARLYQQAGQTQKCLAACDDLVLWFHSGKYVTKALELKKHYAPLTPKQQQIYEDSLKDEQERASKQAEDEDDDNVVRNIESTDGEVIAETIIAETEKEIAGQVSAHKAELDKEAALTGTETGPEETKDLQVELAKSMRKIISGVVRHNEISDEDIPASVDTGIRNIRNAAESEAEEQIAGQLSIDDILLSMSDKGKSVADAVIRAADEEESAEAVSGKTEEPHIDAESVKAEEPDITAEPAQKEETDRKAVSAQAEGLPGEPVSKEKTARTEPAEESPRRRRLREQAMSVTAAAEDELTDVQREALQYTNHPEKLLKNRSALPTYSDDSKIKEPDEEEDDFGKTRRIVNTKEELLEAAKKEILAEKTIRIPTEEIGRRMQEMRPEDDAEYTEEYSEDSEELPYGAEQLPEEDGYFDETDVQAYENGEQPSYEEDGESPVYEDGYEEEYLQLPEHLKPLFSGFTEVEGLEEQIANAILQAEEKGSDRTSRSGNILIFGAHGSGKTTLAMNIAKAIAQDKGSQVMKMAKIYASDLNRKDIAATVAKIAGGALIIEEAGDLESATVEQLTTAMEFRTNGLIVILEDEQKYVHELLMKHPRFTMKFTAQIYIPEYTADELEMFGRKYANALDYVISEEARDDFYQKILSAMEGEQPVAITDVTAIVDRAVARSNKFFRKIAMGKRRYDENDYIILFPKDFR